MFPRQNTMDNEENVVNPDKNGTNYEKNGTNPDKNGTKLCGWFLCFSKKTHEGKARLCNFLKLHLCVLYLNL